MTYKIDPGAYGSVFVLPRSLAENDLILASGAFLKTLVWVFAHAGEAIGPEAVSRATGESAEDVDDALRYWAKKGYLTADTPAGANETAERTEAQPAPAQKASVPLTPSKPSYEVICSRLEEDAAVRALFSEAQLRLGRTIGTADQASLLLLYDYYGLPAEVILAICEYARLHKKERNMGYIYTVGMDWGKREINTIEAADEELKRLESVNTRWTQFARMTGIKGASPTTAQQKYLSVWLDEWHFSFDMLSLAYEEMTKNTDKTSFPYMNRILSNWKGAGVDTPEKAAQKEKEFKLAQIDRAAAAAAQTQKAKKKTEPAAPASYDMEKAVQKMNTTVPKLKKKEKR